MACKTHEKSLRDYPRWFKYFYFCALTLVGSGCSLSMVMNHSEGTTSDLVDENQTASPVVSPNL